MLCPCSDTTITFAPISYKKSRCSINGVTVSSSGFVVKNVLNQALAISKFRSDNAFFKIETFRGYLFPTSLPLKPVKAISLIHCSNVFSAPSSGISSFVQPIGAIPSLTVFSLNISSSLLYLSNVSLQQPHFLLLLNKLLPFQGFSPYLHKLPVHADF